MSRRFSFCFNSSQPFTATPRDTVATWGPVLSGAFIIFHKVGLTQPVRVVYGSI
jgi:hypothetical protein